MGQAYHMGHIHQGSIREVGHIAAQLLIFKGLLDGFRIGQLTPGEIQDPYALFQAGDESIVDHTLGIGHQGHMDGDIIGVLDGVFHGIGPVHGTGQGPGVGDGNIGVIAHYIHAKALGSRIGYQRADGAKADHGQLLAPQLGAHKLVLALFHKLGKVGVVLHGFHPLDAAGDIAAGKEQAAHDQFGHGVGIGAGGVEYHDTLLGALVNGDVIHAGARPGDGQEGFGQFHIVHGGAAHENSIRGGLVVGDGVIAGGQGFMNNGRNRIERLNLEHGRILLSR